FVPSGPLGVVPPDLGVYMGGGFERGCQAQFGQSGIQLIGPIVSLGPIHQQAAVRGFECGSFLEFGDGAIESALLVIGVGVLEMGKSQSTVRLTGSTKVKR